MTIPEELKQCPQWVAWRYGPPRGKGKPTKIPLNPNTGNPARVDHPMEWGTFQEATAAKADGIGFVFTKDDRGIDLDGCRDAETDPVECATNDGECWQ